MAKCNHHRSFYYAIFYEKAKIKVPVQLTDTVNKGKIGLRR